MKERNSSIEILRIICILMIICLHLLAPFWQTQSFLEKEFIIFFNSIFNTGVTIFVLISGFYGIKYKTEKFFDITNTVWFYSILFFVTSLIIPTNHSFWNVLQSFLPLSLNKYWFITSYLIIFCLSPLLNLAKDKLSYNQFTIIIIILLYFFYINPTFLFRELTHDSGKGVLNMMTIYLVGQYISKYGVPIFIKKNKFLIGIAAVFCIFTLNSFLSSNKGFIWLPFSRDNSLFILILSLIIFCYFESKHYQNKKINLLATYTLSVYIIQEELKFYINNGDICFDSMILTIYLRVCGLVLICLLIEKVRRLFLHKIFQKLLVFEISLKNKLKSKINE